MIHKFNKLIAAGHLADARAELETIKYSLCFINYKVSDRYLRFREGEGCRVEEKVVSYADNSYINNFRDVIGSKQQMLLDKLNFNWENLFYIQKDHGECFLRAIADTGYNHEMISNYINERSNLFRSRYEQEYSIIRGGVCDIFPYKYITDFSIKSTLDFGSDGPSATKPSVSFIYCVKNRSKRLRVSLESLISSLIHSPLDYEIIIAEDNSGDIFPELPADDRYSRIQHYVVDTNISWTRSGLLNFGIRHSSKMWVAFLDVDFLFDSDFGCNLHQVLDTVDQRKIALVVNSIETETSIKQGVVYSAGSPYGYMWLCGRNQALNVNGFDEGFTGHGFEDRDFQDKLTNLESLKIVDSLSFDRNLFVLHLSHIERTGSDNRAKNKDRYRERTTNNSERNRRNRANWGDYNIIKHRDYSVTPIVPQ